MGDKKVLLIGDECVDIFIYGNVDRINPEAPTPIFDKNSAATAVERYGMAGNVSSNLISLSRGDISVDTIVNKQKQIKTRYVDLKSGQILLRVDEAPEEMDVFSRFKYSDHLENTKYDAIVVSDYAKGFLNKDDIRFIISQASIRGIPTFFDTKKTIDSAFEGATFVKINEKEHKESCAQLGIAFNHYPENYIVTLGPLGCMHHSKEDYVPRNFKGHNVEVSCVSGAGDTVLAALVVRYLETGDVKKSIEFSMLAAAEAVKHRNVVSVKRESLKDQ